MNHTKKILLALSLSAVVIGGGCAANDSEVSVSTKNTSEVSSEASKLKEQIVRAKTISDFENVQFEGITFGKASFGTEIKDRSDGKIELVDDILNESVVVDKDLFEKYKGQPLYPLFENDDLTGSEEEREEFRKTEALTVRMDPWVSMYNFAERIDTEGKTFAQVYEETNMDKYRGYIVEGSLENSRKYLSEEYGIVELEEKTKEQLKEAEEIVREVDLPGIETEGKTIEEIKEELLKANATYRLKEESKDMPYDPNWLIEEDKWWKGVIGSS
ncbi:hypothetical protein [Bacillus solimangrovi]|uniref:Lipoprotein n=1 Tax=Bacillus solimangrovi TaxID=1305675 RepID=A0A1E5LBA6_9BACI|nr:hypothetical protein [Bacillus solimangrovi]OEH91353.1 hypothetical protein BFG57_05665 [Bacillus solimangrovi]